MDQAVDAGLDLDEDPEISDRLDLAVDPGARRVCLLRQLLPRIGLGLLQAERNPPVGLVDPEHLDLHHVADVDDLRGMHHALGPSHLRDVDQPLDALLQFDERAVIGDAHDLALDPQSDRIALRDLGPRVGHDLLHPQRNALALGVVLEHNDLDLVADLDRFGRMLQSAPRHVGDVKQAVDAAEIDERAVVGDVLDGAFEDYALFQHAQRLFLERGALVFEHAAARNHHVAAGAVELQNLKATALADVAVKVAQRAGCPRESRAGRPAPRCPP